MITIWLLKISWAEIDLLQQSVAGLGDLAEIYSRRLSSPHVIHHLTDIEQEIHDVILVGITREDTDNGTHEPAPKATVADGQLSGQG